MHSIAREDGLTDGGRDLERRSPRREGPAQEGRSRLRKRLDGLFPYGLILPIGLLLLGVTFYPTGYAVWLALTDASLISLDRAQFIGLQNFLDLFQDGVFLDSLWRTVRWDVVVVGAELVIALPVALFLNLDFVGRGLVRSAVLIPYIVPHAVTGLMWVYVFDGNFGVFNDIMVRLGLIDRFVSWMGDPAASFSIVAAAMTWTGMPLMAIILLAALPTIPGDPRSEEHTSEL